MYRFFAFLATPAASYITGTTIAIDGGVGAWGQGGRPPLDEDPPPAPAKRTIE